jgi:hypothetical protein
MGGARMPPEIAEGVILLVVSAIVVFVVVLAVAL